MVHHTDDMPYLDFKNQRWNDKSGKSFDVSDTFNHNWSPSAFDVCAGMCIRYALYVLGTPSLRVRINTRSSLLP